MFTESITLEGISILMSVTGTFNFRNDPTFPNTAHLTLIFQTVTLSVDDVTVISLSFEELEELSSKLEEEEALPKIITN